MAQRRDSRGRFASGGGGGGPKRASSFSTKSVKKAEVGYRGKRLRNAPNNSQRLPETGSMWTRRRAEGRGRQGSVPKGTISKSKARR